MIQKKICMLGAYAVGKTSLVRQFVHSIFDERYHTTVGVKIDKKQLSMNGQDVALMLWDIHGEDEFQSIRVSYLRGMAGYLLVADGTRAATWDRVHALQLMAEKTAGKVPFLVLVNKSDLDDEWELTDEQIAEGESNGWTILKTSAKTGESVEEAFHALTARMLEG